MLALAALFLRGDAPLPVRAAGAGAAAAVAAVALHAAWQLIPGSRARLTGGARRRWPGYAAVGALAAAFAGPWVVLVLLAAGAAEVAARRPRLGVHAWALLAAAPASRRDGRPGLGGTQGGRALLRRRLRDRAADAGRRGRSLRVAVR